MENPSKISREDILAFACEIKETSDTDEVARLLQSHNWIAVEACESDIEMVWVLVRIF